MGDEKNSQFDGGGERVKIMSNENTEEFRNVGLVNFQEGALSVQASDVTTRTDTSQALRQSELQAAGDEAFKKKDFASALNSYGKALTIDPENPTLILNVAEIYRILLQFEDCAPLCDRGLEIQCATRKDRARFYYLIGLCNIQMGDLEEARDAFNSSLREKLSAAALCQLSGLQKNLVKTSLHRVENLPLFHSTESTQAIKAIPANTCEVIVRQKQQASGVSKLQQNVPQQLSPADHHHQQQPATPSSSRAKYGQSKSVNVKGNYSQKYSNGAGMRDSMDHIPDPQIIFNTSSSKMEPSTSHIEVSLPIESNDIALSSAITLPLQHLSTAASCTPKLKVNASPQQQYRLPSSSSLPTNRTTSVLTNQPSGGKLKSVPNRAIKIIPANAKPVIIKPQQQASGVSKLQQNVPQQLSPAPSKFKIQKIQLVMNKNQDGSWSSSPSAKPLVTYIRPKVAPKILTQTFDSFNTTRPPSPTLTPTAQKRKSNRKQSFHTARSDEASFERSPDSTEDFSYEKTTRRKAWNRSVRVQLKEERTQNVALLVLGEEPQVKKLQSECCLPYFKRSNHVILFFNNYGNGGAILACSNQYGQLVILKIYKHYPGDEELEKDLKYFSNQLDAKIICIDRAVKLKCKIMKDNGNEVEVLKDWDHLVVGFLNNIHKFKVGKETVFTRYKKHKNELKSWTKLFERRKTPIAVSNFPLWVARLFQEDSIKKMRHEADLIDTPKDRNTFMRFCGFLNAIRVVSDSVKKSTSTVGEFKKAIFQLKKFKNSDLPVVPELIETAEKLRDIKVEFPDVVLCIYALLAVLYLLVFIRKKSINILCSSKAFKMLNALFLRGLILLFEESMLYSGKLEICPIKDLELD